MPAYRFEALQSDGQPRKGTLEADSARSARNQLRAQGLVPLVVEGLHSSKSALEDQQPWWQKNLGKPRRVFSTAARTIWIRQMAGLVSGGLTVERALSALADDAPNDAQRHVLAAVRAEVNAGSSLGHALSLFSNEFPEIDRAVIAAGEQSGQLGNVFEHLATDLENQQQLRSKLVGAALYPAIVTLVALAIVIFLVTSVVPQVAGVFAGNHQRLPWLTQALLNLSAFLQAWGLLLVALCAAGVVALRYLLVQKAVRLRWDAAWLRLPVIGSLDRSYNSARFAATLSMLVSSGVPILKAMQAAADTLPNQALRADALEALDQVREGAPLALALARRQRFSGLVSMFARLGEQTGELPLMLQRASQQLSNEVQRRALALATVLEPLLIVVMGGVVMVIVLAVLMPIMEVNQWVR